MNQLLFITGASDYTVNTARTAALVSGRIMNVVLTFHVDTIAQEPNETFTLTLVVSRDLMAEGLQGEELFFRNTIEVTIIDNDGKDITCQIYTVHVTACAIKIIYFSV